jgi:hypothetical protein
MRQGQQNRRGRGRNRKGHHHNPLTRSFESNGPDVKIRGTPAHIAEKYISLARDAQASGDPVLAESYLQYAEHYNRIIMSYREQQMQQGDMMNGGGGRFRPMPGADSLESGDDFGDEEGEEVSFDGQQQIRGQEPQPRTFEPQPRGDDRPQRIEGRPHRERFGEQRPIQSERQERPERQERVERASDASTGEQSATQPRAEPPRRRDRLAEPHEQPEFLRRPVRRPRRDGGPRQQNGSDQEAPASKDDDPIDKSPA